MSSHKWCPICEKTEWDYDVGDGLFTYCRGCYDKIVDYAQTHFRRNEEGLFTVSDWLRAIAEVRDNN